MSWAFIWLFLGILTTAVFLVFAAALGRHAIIIGRTARRFRDEVGPIARDVSREGSETSDRAQALRVPRRARRSKGAGYDEATERSGMVACSTSGRRSSS